MASSELTMRLSRTWRSLTRPSICNQCLKSRRAITTEAARAGAENPSSDLVDSTSLSTGPLSDAEVTAWDPLKSSRERKRQLPPSRYQYRPPKYDRGPLHPHRPPPNSDPSSRVFVPGPFSTPRLEATYHSTIAPDFMTLCYQHTPPGFRAPQKGPRLRPWEGSSPYLANRQLRGPRGGDVLRLLRRPITFRNIPMLERITVHAYCKNTIKGGSAYIHVAGMVLQAITNVRVTTHKSKTGEAAWGLIKGKQTVSATADLKGENMYHFLTKLVSVVMPKIKDWKGLRATTGDSSGNLSLGLTPDVVGSFPEVEVNYDSYPPKMIPGLYITIHTTATCDKDARLLCQQIGVPFYGKIVD